MLRKCASDFDFGKRQNHFHDGRTLSSIRLCLRSIITTTTVRLFFPGFFQSPRLRYQKTEESLGLRVSVRMSRYPRRTAVAITPYFPRSFRRTVAHNQEENRANLSFASFRRSDGHRDLARKS